MSQEDKSPEDSIPGKLLAHILEAMKHPEEFEKAYTWNESKWDTPPLIPTGREKVDPEAFKAFDKILYFLTLSVFGVGCEGRARGKLVDYYLKNSQTDMSVLPYWRVPYYDSLEDGSIRNLVRSLECAENNLDLTQELVKRLKRNMKYHFEDQFNYEDFKKRAQGCKTCDGRGFVKYSKKAWEELRKSAWADKEEQTAAARLYFKRAGDSTRKSFRIPFRATACTTCQSDEDLKIR